MPRGRRKSTGAPSLSAGQAHYILERLIADRRVSASEVNRYAGDIQREIDELERRLQSLRSAAGSSTAPVRRGPGRPPGSGARAAGEAPASTGGRRRRRRSAALTPEQRASRQLQGRYLGLIRQIPATRRAQYAKIAKEKGREAAIKEMQTALKK